MNTTKSANGDENGEDVAGMKKLTVPLFPIGGRDVHMNLRRRGVNRDMIPGIDDTVTTMKSRLRLRLKHDGADDESVNEDAKRNVRVNLSVRLPLLLGNIAVRSLLVVLRIY
jgi:hypothetical protein